MTSAMVGVVGISGILGMRCDLPLIGGIPPLNTGVGISRGI